MPAPRGNPSLPAAEFLFSVVNQRSLERHVIASVLKDVWMSSIEGEKNWKLIGTLVSNNLKELYGGFQKGLDGLIFFDAQPLYYRDKRHVRYHWEHSSFLIDELIIACSEHEILDFPAFVENTISTWDEALLGPALTDIARGYEFRGSVADPALLMCIKEIDDEYLSFLSRHSNIVDRIAWEAFEKIAALIFASRGYEVKHIGTSWGDSADLLVCTNNSGIMPVKSFIVECKRYRNSRKVGLDIVNGVLGAKLRKGADAAFLLTTGGFTKAVEKERKNLQQLNLYLRDGQELMEWLKHYVKRNNGLDNTPIQPEEIWLPLGWEVKSE